MKKPKDITLALCTAAIVAAIAFTFRPVEPAPAGDVTPESIQYMPVIFNQATFANLHIVDLSPLTNPEFLVIKNTSQTDQDLASLRVMNGETRERIQFVSSRILAPGATLRLETNSLSEHNFPDVYQWTTLEIWPDSGGTAYLLTDLYEVIDSVCYGNACP
jgi:hypothetical protein